MFLRRYYSFSQESAHYANEVEVILIKKPFRLVFYICPLSNNVNNIEIALRKSLVEKHNVNLHLLFDEIIDQNPYLKEKLKDATLIGQAKGVKLDLLSKKPIFSGERCLYIGDTVGSINPITGYGVGNAMTHAILCADIIEEALYKNDFSKHFLKKFDRSIIKRMGKKYNMSRILNTFEKMIPAIEVVFDFSLIRGMLSRLLVKMKF
jgi:menaquinone-9 beta-reductase